MRKKISLDNLEKKLLVASPSIGSESPFFHSVLYVHKQTDIGISCIISNQPVEVSTSDLLFNIGVEPTIQQSQDFQNILIGGPEHRDCGLVIYRDKSTKSVIVSRCLNTFQSIILGKGPPKSEIVLGFCSWSHDSILEEIINNYWLISYCNDAILFNAEYHQRWKLAINNIGLTPNNIQTNSDGNC